MKLKQTLLASAILAASATSAAAFDTLIFQKIFKSSFKPWGLSTSTTIVRYGKTSERFEVRAGDCGISDGGTFNDCEHEKDRHELATWRTGTRIPGNGDNMWYRLSVYIPKTNAKSPGMEYSIFQLFSVGNGQCAPILKLVHSEPFGIWAKGIGYEKYGSTIIPEKDVKGKWHDIVVNVLYSPREFGYFQIFVNGERKITSFQPTISFDCTQVYIKYGIYRFESSKNAPKTIVYFDGVRRSRNEDLMFKELDE